MKKPYLGIWLDHTEAYLIWADAQGQTEVQHVESEYEEQKKRPATVVAGATGGVYGGVPPHADIEERRRNQTKRFYEGLFKSIHEAERVFIFGPGQAKHEMEKHLRAHKDFSGRITGVEAADKMTVPQMGARVKDSFGLPHSPP